MTKKKVDVDILLHASGEDYIPPDPGRLIDALRQIGYTFEQAISDLVDNCINAKAAKVLVRFITHGNKITSLIVADNGNGMSPGTLRMAMRFGTEKESDAHSLGKFGMGMKLASLSHAKSLTVVTRSGGRISARRWTIKGIKKGWECDELVNKEADALIDSPWADLNLSKKGTLVIWKDIDKLPTSSSGIKPTIRRLQKRLQLHLGMVFHRFIEDGKVEIKIDSQESGEDENKIQIPIDPLNPFDYPRSGNDDYPKYFKADVSGVGQIKMQAHIWPPNSDRPEYKLGRRAASMQGFYFYRNDRLIQAGGWNGILQNESEPHSSLARVRIELPAKYDEQYSLDVQKTKVEVPVGFVDAVNKAKSDDGLTFSDFRKIAEQVYRSKDAGAKKSYPLLPHDGLPVGLINKARNIISPASRKVRNVTFEWAEFESGDLFEVNQDKKIIFINRAYRKYLLGGLSPGKTDLPLLKLLLFFLSEDDLNKTKISSKRKEKLAQINMLLTEAAKKGKG